MVNVLDGEVGTPFSEDVTKMAQVLQKIPWSPGWLALGCGT